MKFSRVLPPVVCLCMALFAGAANAQSNDTFLYFVHGASGRSVSSSANPAYPVDVLVNGQFCIVQGAAFGDIKGPFTAAAGNFSFKVSVASTSSPCGNPAIYEVSTALTAGQTYFGVFNVTPNGKFYTSLVTADYSTIAAGQSRVVIANYTDKTLSASLTAESNNETNSLNYIAPGTFQTAVAPSGKYSGGIYVAGTQNLVLGPLSANLQSRDYSIYFLSGSVANSSVQLIGPKTIKNVF
jgi:hypothetical protein